MARSRHAGEREDARSSGGSSWNIRRPSLPPPRRRIRSLHSLRRWIPASSTRRATDAASTRWEAAARPGAAFATERAMTGPPGRDRVVAPGAERTPLPTRDCR